MNCKPLLLFLFTLILFVNSYPQKILFPYPVSENNFISFDDTNFYCAYLKVNDSESPDFRFFISDEKSKGIILYDENFIKVNSQDYYLMNFRFAFLTMKYNVVPYLHPDFVIRFLYLLNKVKYYPRVSDAMRTTEEQLKYKKRGWSNVEDSPHLLGLAADLSYYTKYERNTIQQYYKPLGLRYLEHGGRGNSHIHLQEDILWLMNKNINISGISDLLNKDVSENYNILKPYTESLYAEKFTDGIKIEFTANSSGIIKVEFVNSFGIKQAEVTAGVFENGNHKFYIRNDFLKEGIYCIRVFKNGLYLYQKSFIKFEIKQKPS